MKKVKNLGIVFWGLVGLGMTILWSVTGLEGSGLGGSLVYMPAFFHPAPYTGPCEYQTVDRIVNFEIESTPAIEQWIPETDIAGFSGSSYYTWRGIPYYEEPGTAILSYTFRTFEADTYQMRIHNYKSNPLPGEDNDVWVRMDGGEWYKLFSIVTQAWSWNSLFDISPDYRPAAFYELQPGVHQLDISVRSPHFGLDRVTFYGTGLNSEDINLPISPCVPLG